MSLTTITTVLIILILTVIHRIVCVRQLNAPWHLARLSNLDQWPSEPPYNYDFYSAKSPVTVYLLDTGIDANHPEFGGRVRLGANFYGPSALDDSGRGTHLAGIIGSRTFGVAKKAELVSVKIKSGLGTGQAGDAADGVRWSRGDIRDPSRSIICLPSATFRTEDFNLAVNNTVRAGIPVIVAAGDHGDDVYWYSPGSAEKAFTVGATDINDQFAEFTNYGPELDMLAPGVAVESTWFLHGSPLDQDRDTRTMTGTAQATALVCGLAAYYRSLDIGIESPAALFEVLNMYALDNLVRAVPNDTTNRLAQNNFDET